MEIETSKPSLKFATASCDKSIKIFVFDESTKTYEEKADLHGHSDWVRDVSWCPSMLNSYDLLASCSEVENSFDKGWKRDTLEN